ncbi:glycosyltransferase [Marinobacterium sp. D7]|uniref:glycosyltransferase family 2 protein n=1 Tax=Marinobacterium ramblicola TaxID=2849041 RepID=UPI001C2DCD63|nr:glycosyltransferase [Marinobacterium ramblicola]MBV1788882.1 glycosyltransferase [Marinobacterium ramblicola]
MKVSVIVPVYNLQYFVESCLLSLLEQETDFAYEVIAVDDGSTDDSWQIMQALARKFPHLKALQNPHNMGLAKTQRRLLREARGDYIAYVDGDDLALPGKLQALSNHLDAHPGCQLCYHEADMFDHESGKTIKLYTQGYYNFSLLKPSGNVEDLILYGNFVNASSVMFRRHERMLSAIDEGCKIILDYPWHILNLLLRPGTLDFLSQVLGRYRMHSQSFGGMTRASATRREQSLQDMLRACDNALAFDVDQEIVARGKSHHLYSAALYFLRELDFKRFARLVEDSVRPPGEAGRWFFDDRHQLAWENRNDPERVYETLFGGCK